MTPFTSIFIDGTKYNSGGGFAIVGGQRVVVIDSSELQPLFSGIKRDERKVHQILFYQHDKIIAECENEYILDNLQGSEAQFYPTK